MTRQRLRAVPRTGFADRAAPHFDADHPLAGSSTVWFDSIDVIEGGQRCEQVLSANLTAPALARLSARRADVCGLSLERPRIMGILNVTPDSFSDGGQFTDISRAIAQAGTMAETADILDIGGESTRPGATTVSADAEIDRVVPVIAAIRAAGIRTPISVDTRKSAVAQAALAAGANMINDVSALTHDPEMASVVARAGVPVCLMHAQGDPATMQDAPRYDDVLCDVFDWLEARVAHACAAGIAPDQIIVDPGIGFGKTLQHNLKLLRNISLYHDLGLPILLGASRKRFIGTISGATEVGDRLAGSVAVALHGAAQGVQILRVHDTGETRQALSLQQALIGTGADDAKIIRHGRSAWQG